MIAPRDGQLIRRGTLEHASTVGLWVLTRSFRPPPGLLPGVARSHPETSGNKNPSRARPNHRQKIGMAQAIPNILVVEDDRETRALIARYLRSNACNVTTATDGREMVRTLTDHRFDLVILDVMLPGEDGLTLCRKVRAQSQTPIIMLTARGEDVDRILGLEMGADDYLAKPFNPRELLARINAVLRRQAIAFTASATEGATALTFAGWRIDLRLRELRNPEGARVAMTSAEFDLLRTFCERPGRVLSRDSLLDLTQGRSTGSFERSIDVLVSRIRRKVEPNPADPTMIKTVRSGGYLFTPRTEVVRTEAANTETTSAEAVAAVLSI